MLNGITDGSDPGGHANEGGLFCLRSFESPRFGDRLYFLDLPWDRDRSRGEVYISFLLFRVRLW